VIRSLMPFSNPSSESGIQEILSKYQNSDKYEKERIKKAVEKFGKNVFEKIAEHENNESTDEPLSLTGTTIGSILGFYFDELLGARKRSIDEDILWILNSQEMSEEIEAIRKKLRIPLNLVREDDQYPIEMSPDGSDVVEVGSEYLNLESRPTKRIALEKAMKRFIDTHHFTWRIAKWLQEYILYRKDTGRRPYYDWDAFVEFVDRPEKMRYTPLFSQEKDIIKIIAMCRYAILGGSPPKETKGAYRRFLKYFAMAPKAKRWPGRNLDALKAAASSKKGDPTGVDRHELGRTNKVRRIVRKRHRWKKKFNQKR
jgi:hypothetical protein